MQERHARGPNVLLTVAGMVLISLISSPSMTLVPKPGPVPEPRDFARTAALSSWMLRSIGVEPGSSPRLLAGRDGQERGREFHLFSPVESDARSTKPLTVPLDVPFADEIERAASRYDLDHRLVAAIVEVESRFDPEVVSPRGARGLMQLMPSTAPERAEGEFFDPALNLDLGSRYLSALLKRFDGDLSLALAAYNAGPSAVERFGGVPPYRETRHYVRKVLTRYAEHRGDAASVTLASR